MAETEAPAAVDLDIVAGEMGVGAPACEDRRLLVSEQDERAGAFHLGQRGAPEAHLPGRRAANRQAVPVEDERLSRAKLSSRVLGEPDVRASHGASICRRGGKSHQAQSTVVVSDLGEVLLLAAQPDEAARFLADAARLFEQKGNLPSAERARRLAEDQMARARGASL